MEYELKSVNMISRQEDSFPLSSHQLKTPLALFMDQT